MDGDGLTVVARPASQVLEPGTRLRVGTVVECVGSGSTGHVYRVLDELGSPVAVREYFPEALATRQDGLVFPLPQRDAGFEAGRKRFDEDGGQLASIDHPGLLKVMQVWSEGGTSYQAMPWYEGRTLEALLHTTPEPPSQQQLSDWLRAMADALSPVHRQVGVHGHLSPSQVMLLDSGRLMVMEFSRAARFLARDPRDIERDPYAALECGSDARYGPAGPWTDIYAMAAIAHFAVRGRPPQSPVRRLAYDAQEPLLQDIDGDYEDAFLHGIDCGLALRPRSRPRDLAAFMARAGLHERRARPRGSGESLLTNLHMADPAGWPAPSSAAAEPRAPAPAEAAPPPTEVSDLDIPIEPERAAKAEAAAPVGDAAPPADPDPPFEDAEDEPWPPESELPPLTRRASRPARSKPIQVIPLAPERRRGGTGRWLASLAGVGAATAIVALAVMPGDPVGELTLSAPSVVPVPDASRTPGSATMAEQAAAAEVVVTQALGAASAVLSSTPSPIPDPLEPTAAGPSAQPSVEPGVAGAPAEAPAVAEPATPAVQEGAASLPAAQPAAPPQALAPARTPAPRPRPAEAPAAVRASEDPTDRPTDRPTETATPSSPCPGLLARQYIGRPLDAAEREQMNALCR